MDFGVVGLDTLVCSNNGSLVSENAAEGNTHKRYGSGFINQERAVNDDELRGYKVAKTSSCGEAMLKIPLQRSNEAHQQMLSFSSPNSQAMALPYYHHTSSPFSRNAGYGSAGINAASVLLTGFRGHFTASQWMELEHQALIYKYIDANVPIPSYLLNPIRKALESAGFTGFSSLRPTALGWGGGFHLGFSNSDPEPGRCRRTDGKKWRCSRDAVVDQKYCERHMNRGRHRSRKPVEGQSGNTNSNSILKPTPPPMASSNIASVVPAAGRDAINLGLSHQANNNSNNHLSGLLPNINRNKENMEAEYRHTTVLSMNSISKERAYEQESSSIRPTEFGLVCSDSLLNPLNNHHPLRQFMDECPKSSRSENPVISNWSDIDRSREFEATKMGLGVGPSFSDQRWEPSMGMGGPLGEVLHYECNKRTESAALNLMESCWDNSNSPRLGVSSPTGVLQRCTFGSVSNSSAGSSPRAESGSGLIGMGLVQHPSLPAP